MGRFRFQLFLGVVLCFATSCQGIFDSNLFNVIDSPNLPSDADLKKASLGDIQNLLDSDKNKELLKSDPGAREALGTNLATVMAEGTPAEQAQAAELFLELQLEGTGALDACNNLLNALGALSGLDNSDLGADPEALQAVLASVFGNDPATIAATLEGLQNMVGAFQLLDDLGGLGDLGGDYALAGPMSVLADILLSSSTTTPASQGLVDFITGKTDAMTDFNVGNLEAGFTELADAVSGTDLAGGSDYAYMNNLPGFMP